MKKIFILFFVALCADTMLVLARPKNLNGVATCASYLESDFSNGNCSGNTEKVEQSNQKSIHGKKIKTKTRNTDKVSVTTNEYADGYVETITVSECPSCKGKKICYMCGGTGMGLMGLNCPICMGQGTCRLCFGTGVFVNTTGSYTNTSSGYSNGSSPAGTGNRGGGSSSRGHSSYITCKYCNGTGVCSRCNGKCGKWEDVGYYTGKTHYSFINCGGCNGTGRCSICRGRGKL